MFPCVTYCALLCNKDGDTPSQVLKVAPRGRLARAPWKLSRKLLLLCVRVPVCAWVRASERHCACVSPSTRSCGGAQRGQPPPAPRLGQVCGGRASLGGPGRGLAAAKGGSIHPLYLSHLWVGHVGVCRGRGELCCGGPANLHVLPPARLPGWSRANKEKGLSKLLIPC